MASVHDSACVETMIAYRLVDFQGKDVLDIGFGDRILTWCHSTHATLVLATDSKETKIALHGNHIPEHLRSLVNFQTPYTISINIH